ncbi:hypothetical protein NHX12_026942 [Muraenolepis orangiensis]|uniref:NF-kappa-B inhibitor-like protein 1 n=1 Tax=Muraenolepis orangiensis TaxID=630683 RepID=A0A9Q0EFR0_9TELE|nr:hypothetical protein NHX12_026942 [Muraenolepis orangiensis]
MKARIRTRRRQRKCPRLRRLRIFFSWCRGLRRGHKAPSSLLYPFIVRPLGGPPSLSPLRGLNGRPVTSQPALSISCFSWRTAYVDLVVPLQQSCPEARQAQNSAGVSPDDLLQWMKDEPPKASRGQQQETEDPEQKWREKLFGACGDSLPVDEEEDDFGDWADRIRKEYYDRRSAEAQRLVASSSRRKRRETSTEREEKERANKDLQEKLQKEHQEYLARAQRKEEETQRAKKRRYDQKCESTFRSDASGPGATLSYGDIPWPGGPGATPTLMLEVMLHGADRNDLPAYRKLLKRQQTLWHPDRFAQRCGSRLKDSDRQKILDTVTALSQDLNRLAQTLRD